MKSPFIRLAIAAVAVVIIFGIAWYSSHKGGVYREIHLPQESISTIPMEIGKWKGTDVPVEEKLFRGIAAHEVVSRSYANPAGETELTLHCAVFNTFWRRVPHSPKVCYRASGWTTIKDEAFELDDPDDPDNPDGRETARLVTFEKDGATVFVLFWFQFGDFVVCDASDLASARWQYRNEETWPPVVKMMLQISADRPERAKKQLKEFADKLHKITRTFK